MVRLQVRSLKNSKKLFSTSTKLQTSIAMPEQSAINQKSSTPDKLLVRKDGKKKLLDIQMDSRRATAQKVEEESTTQMPKSSKVSASDEPRSPRPSKAHFWVYNREEGCFHEKSPQAPEGSEIKSDRTITLKYLLSSNVRCTCQYCQHGPHKDIVHNLAALNDAVGRLEAAVEALKFEKDSDEKTLRGDE